MKYFIQVIILIVPLFTFSQDYSNQWVGHYSYNQIIDIDDSTGAVFFATTKGLVKYKGIATDPEENLDNVVAFPNAVRPEFYGAATIGGLTSRSNVKITDIEGNLVYKQVGEGGSIQLDTTAFGRYKVASGVYLILVTGEDQAETTVSKLLIVR